MSTLNLVPWRERHRRAVMGRWQWGVLLSGLATAALVNLVDQGLTAVNQSHEERMASLRSQQQVLEAQLSDAAVWRGRERQAKQLQLVWPHWRQQQWRAWQAFMQLLSVSPQGVQLTYVQWQEGQWHVQLRALHPTQVQRWQTALQAQGLVLSLKSSDAPIAGWRCPQGRLWRLHSFELNSPGQAGTS